MAKASPALSTPQVFWLLATGVAVIAPLAPHQPAWLCAAAILILCWRGWLIWRRQPLPSRWWLVMLVATGTGGVLLEFHTLFGQNPGVALLVLFLALKQMEARTVRDGRAAVFLAYFLALAQFFYSQAIPAALAAATAVVVVTATLASLADARVPPLAQLRRAGTMLLQATPFMLLLFVLFPRIHGPLWGLPRDAHSGLTGLSETMAPGAISELSLSDAIAFRVRFSGPTPAPRQRYWRGPVLSEFDGLTWRPYRELPRPRLPYDEPSTGGTDYEVTLEAHGKRWLLALELPGQVPADGFATRDFQLLTRSSVTERMRYEVRSYPNLHAGSDETEFLRRQALLLPPASNPRTRALGASWRAAAADDEEVLQLAQAFFLNQRLTYTLSPPLLGRHTADEFLFDTKQGFCEHFANAFAVAMRAAGIPARVVTGYQGGEINPIDGYMTVRQSDAHAWTEVWLPRRGWLRIDPTAISAPLRIDANLAAAVPAGDPLPMLLRLDATWLHGMHLRWDAVANAWNQWILGYDPERQRDLLRRLGMPSPDWRAMTIALTALSAVTMIVLAAVTLRNRQRRDPATRLWAKLSRRLARHGLARRDAEGPLDYAERVGTALPAIADDMRGLATLYAELRYARGGPQLLTELRRRMASFRP